jgi:DNA helicase-4
VQQIESFIETFKDLNKQESTEIITLHNRSFLEKHLVADKAYLDNVLKMVDPAINLDDKQRRVVLSDEDYMLVIAGAGAGKTTTVAAKVKYLVEKKHIQPDQILVISFTNKAVGELQSKINKALKIKLSSNYIPQNWLCYSSSSGRRQEVDSRWRIYVQRHQ